MSFERREKSHKKGEYIIYKPSRHTHDEVNIVSIVVTKTWNISFTQSAKL